jgi:hypothetical protein
MASFLVQVSTEQDAELAMASLWYEIELHNLATPDITLEFGGISQIIFCVTSDGAEPAAHVLRAWSKVYGGLCLDSVLPRQSIDLFSLKPQSNGVDPANVTSAIGPVAGIDHSAITVQPFEPT